MQMARNDRCLPTRVRSSKTRSDGEKVHPQATSAMDDDIASCMRTMDMDDMAVMAREALSGIDGMTILPGPLGQIEEPTDTHLSSIVTTKDLHPASRLSPLLFRIQQGRVRRVLGQRRFSSRLERNLLRMSTKPHQPWSLARQSRRQILLL